MKKILVVCSSLDYILIDKLLGDKYELHQWKEHENILAEEAKNHYDLFLMDVSFIQLYRNMIEVLKEKNARMIGLTSDPYDSRNRKLLAMGLSACYLKPLRSDTLAPFIQYWMTQEVKQEIR